MNISRKDAADRRLKAYRDVPFAFDPELQVTFAAEDPYWKLVTALADGAAGADTLQTAVALERLLIEGGADAWIYEFGLPGLLTHAVCIVKSGGRWWVEDGFFNSTFKAPFAEVLEGLARAEPQDRGRDGGERICLTHAEAASRGEACLIAMATRELTPIGGVRRLSVALTRDAYAGLGEEPQAVFEALEDYGLPPTFNSLMLLPLRGLKAGEALDLTRDAADANAWFAAQLGASGSPGRDVEGARRTAERQARRAIERRRALEAELQDHVAALKAAEATSAELAEARNRIAALADIEAERDRAASELEQTGARLGVAEAGLTEARVALDAAEARRERDHQAHATAVQIADSQIVATRAEVEQLQQRLSQLRAAADDAERDVASTRELLAAAQAKNEELSAAHASAAESQSRLATAGDALARHRARALAALQRAAIAERELAHMAQALDETRAGADRQLARLNSDHAAQRAQATEATAALTAELAQVREDLATVSASLQATGARAAVREAQLLEELRLAADAAQTLADLAAAHEADLQEELRLATETAVALTGQLAEGAAAQDILRLTLEDAAAREDGLTEQADGLRKELAEFNAKTRSMRLALDDAVFRETGLLRRTAGLETEVQAAKADLEAAAQREEELRQDAASLQTQLGELGVAHRTLGEALDDVSAREVQAREAGELTTRVLENVARHAAEVGGFAGDPIDAFEAIDRLQVLLRETRDAQAVLEARLAAQAAARARQFGPRLRRMMGALIPGAKPSRTRTLAVASRPDEGKA